MSRRALPYPIRLLAAIEAGHREWADLPTSYLGGQRFYFTGKPCRHGHIAPRRSCGGACLECTQKSGPAPVVKRTEEERAAAQRAYQRRYYHERRKVR